MKIIISDQKNDLNEYFLTSKDLIFIQNLFKKFNIDPAVQQALSIVDEYTYLEIKKWGIEDEMVAARLLQNLLSKFTNNYLSDKHSKENAINYVKEIYFEAKQKGYKTYKKNNPTFEFTPEEKEQYIQNKNAYFKKLEVSHRLMIESNKNFKERNLLIEKLLNNPELNNEILEEAITTNNIELSDGEMDLFIKKLSNKSLY